MPIMTARTVHMIVGLLAIGLAWTAAARAQDIQFQPTEDSPIMTYNAAGPKELAQYDFLAGDWDVVVTMPQPGKEPFVYKAKWHNHWVANGYVMMQEWRGPYATGIELRSFNTATGKWDGHNLYVPTPGIWYDNQAEWTGSEMVVTSQKTTPEGRPFTNREIYRSMEADRFEIRTEVSIDEGASWRPGKYSIVATRAQ